MAEDAQTMMTFQNHLKDTTSDCLHRSCGRVAQPRKHYKNSWQVIQGKASTATALALAASVAVDHACVWAGTSRRRCCCCHVVSWADEPVHPIQMLLAEQVHHHSSLFCLLVISCWLCCRACCDRRLIWPRQAAAVFWNLHA